MKIRPRAGALLAATALALAGLAATVPGAHAATTRPATPALHGTRIALGATSDLFGNAFAEAPNGPVFFSRGAVVYVVDGNHAPVTALHAGGTVLALAATDADLFVENGLRVTEYKRSNGAQVRHWTLSSPVPRATSAGLSVVGSTIWAWTDWATDGSGFEYAEVSRMHTSSSAVHVVSKSAFPADMSANGAGLYFETVRGVTDDLAHASPTTSAVQYRKAPVDAPLALAGGRVDLLNFGSSAADVLSYNAKTLALVSSKRVPEKDDAITGTGLGVLVLASPCSGFPCSSSTVGRLNVGTGGTSGALRTPGAYQLVNGPATAVIEAANVHGTHASMFLVRISA
ncbi:MAG TPA: hypothetical protein VHZ33_17385 [Trebonia sp.]|jgi:hypothetical protein|nr:hypothetical protein [Trebonia sp.]